MQFSPELALSLLQSADEFPVDFDDAWQWIGYFKKQEAKKKLTRNFEREIDYQVFTQTSVNSTQQGSQAGGRPAEAIRLTIDCFKSLGMMAATEKGKAIRRYFLDCERQLKKARQQVEAQSASTDLAQITDRIVKLWLETENCKVTAERSLKTALELARLCGEALLQAKQMVGWGGWEAFRETIKHPQTGKPMPSSTATLYQRIAENWGRIEGSQVRTIRGAQTILRKPRAGKASRLAASTRPTALTALAISPANPFGLIREAMELADRLGGFDDQQRAQLREALFGLTQRAIAEDQGSRIMLERLMDDDRANE